MSFQQYVLPDLATLHTSPFESRYHEYLYRNTFYPSEAVWNHPKLGPLFRCLKIHAQSTDREEFRTMLQQNPFLATEMSKGTARENKRVKKKKTNQQGETTDTSSTVETKTAATKTAATDRKAKKKKKNKKKKKDNKKKKTIHHLHGETTAEVTETNNLVSGETKAEVTDSPAECTEQKFNQEVQLLEENQVASFKLLLKTDAKHVRETFEGYRQLWALRTTTVCAVERLKLLETVHKKIFDDQTQEESNEESKEKIDLVVEWEKHERNIRTTIRLLEPPTPLSPIAVENIFMDERNEVFFNLLGIKQLMLRYNAIQTVAKQVKKIKAILLSSWGLLQENEEEIYYRIHSAMSNSAFVHGKPPNIQKYIDFEISQQELLLCIQQAAVDIVNDDSSKKKTMLSAEIVNLIYAFDYEKNLTLVLKYEQKRRKWKDNTNNSMYYKNLLASTLRKNNSLIEAQNQAELLSNLDDKTLSGKRKESKSRQNKLKGHLRRARKKFQHFKAKMNHPHFSSYFAMNIDSIEGHENYLQSKLTPSIQLEHIQDQIESMKRVKENGDYLQQLLSKDTQILKQDYIQIIDDKAILLFKIGQELSKGPERGTGGLIDSITNYLFTANGRNDDRISELENQLQELTDNETAFVLAGLSGLRRPVTTVQTPTFHCTIRFLALQRIINNNNYKAFPETITKWGESALQELQEMTPWYVDNSWSHNTKNTIRLMLIGLQVGGEANGIYKNIETEQVRKANIQKASEDTARNLQLFEKHVVRPVQTKNSDAMARTARDARTVSRRSAANRARVQQRLDDATKTTTDPNVQKAIEETERNAANRARVQQRLDDAMKTTTDPNVQKAIEETERNAANRARVQQRLDDAMKTTTDANVQKAIEETERKAANRDFGLKLEQLTAELEFEDTDVVQAVEFLNSKGSSFYNDVINPPKKPKAIPVPVVSCVDTSLVFFLTDPSSGGTAVNVMNGTPVAEGVQPDGVCAFNAPSKVDTGNFVSTYFNAIMEGEWLVESFENSINYLTGNGAARGHDYLFKTYISTLPITKENKVTQEQWNKMSPQEQAPYTDALYTAYPSINGLKIRVINGQNILEDQAGNALGTYPGTWQPENPRGGLPPKWIDQVEWNKGITPFRRDPNRGNGLFTD